MPDPDAPNNVAAFLWQDMEIAYDEAANQGVTIANLTTGLPDQIPLARLIEYDDIYLYGDPTSTFDLEAFVYYGVDNSPGAYEMIFAYDNLVGDMSVATIGLENAIANEAYTLLNAGDASTVISDGSVVCVDFSGPTTPYEITYRAVVTGEVGDTITNVVDHSVFAIGYQSDQASMEVNLIDYGELTTTLAGPYRAYDDAEFSVTIDNPVTGGTYPHAQLQYRIKDIDLDHIVSFEYEQFAVADLGVEPKPPAMWVDVPMVQDGDDVVGYIGLEDGYPVYPEYNETVNLRIVIALHGEYEFDFQLADLDETIPVDYIAEVREPAFFVGHIFMPLIFK